MKRTVVLARILVIVVLGCCTLSLLLILASEGSDKPIPAKWPSIDLTAELQTGDIYCDGGSLLFAFADKSGKQLAFWLRARRELNEERAVRVFVKFDPDDLEFEKQEQYILPVGGDQERTLLDFLHKWVDKNVPSEKRDRLVAVTKIRNRKSWQKEFSTISEADERIYRLLAALAELDEPGRGKGAVKKAGEKRG